MIEIASLADPQVAEYAHVGDPAWLEANGLFVAEGRLVVRRLIADARFVVRSIPASPAALASLDDLRAAITAPVYVCDPDVTSPLTTDHTDHTDFSNQTKGSALPGSV